MNGIVVVDKPVGPTSFDVVARLRRALKTRSIGHCGTLDPLASGVLVVAVGEYTKLVRVLTADDKRYTATIGFGFSTTSDDLDGDVVDRGGFDGDRAAFAERVRGALPAFVGAFAQVPPAFSAIHVDGERAHERARRGEEVQMKPRDVVVHTLTLARLVWPDDDAAATTAAAGAAARAPDGDTLSRRAVASQAFAWAVVDVHCGKGTYVRSLARDLGKAVGVPAHLAALRRTASGAYTLDDAAPLDAFEGAGDAYVKRGRAGVRGVPFVDVTDADAVALAQGKRPPTAARFSGTGLACVGDELVALVHVDDGRLVVERGFARSASGGR